MKGHSLTMIINGKNGYGYSCNHVTFYDSKGYFCKLISKFANLKAPFCIHLTYNQLQGIKFIVSKHRVYREQKSGLS